MPKYVEIKDVVRNRSLKDNVIKKSNSWVYDLNDFNRVFQFLKR